MRPLPAEVVVRIRVLRTLPVALVLILAACNKEVPPTSSPTATPPATEPAPADEFVRYTAAQFHETQSISGVSFSADESKILVTSNHTGTPNVYAQPVDGGDLVALTEGSDVARRAISWFPEDDRFLFRADGGGDELAHIFVGEAGKDHVDITPGQGHLARFGDWSADRKSFWVSSNERDPKVFDIYVYDAKTLERKLVFKNEGGEVPEAVDPSLRWIAVDRPVDNADSNIYLVDTKKPKAKPLLITKHESKAEYSTFAFSRDGKSLFYRTNAHSEFDEVWAYDLKRKKHTLVAKDDWDIIMFEESWSGRYQFVISTPDARGKLRIIDTETGQDMPLPPLPEGSPLQTGLSPSETKVATYISTDRTPQDLYYIDLEKQSVARLSNALNPAIDPNELVIGETLKYESWDGLEVPAVLWKPREASPDRKVPVMLWMHGGPGGQTYAMYRATIQYLVNQGYAILGVNNRGSSGYGKTFNHLDDLKHGVVDLDDCVAAKKYLQTLDWVDADRIGIMGGSYGGYLTLAALAFRPEEFKVGIDVFGVANWIRTLESIPPWWEAARQSLYTEVGDPEKDRESLEARSPLLHAGKITKPLLVIQGANDPRVLKVESDEIVAAVEKNGVPVEYVVFDDEGHGFAKRENNIEADEAMVKFLDEHLRGAGE